MYPYLQAAKDVSYLFLISFVMYFLSFPFMYHLALAVESNMLQHNLQCAQFANSRTRNIQPTPGHLNLNCAVIWLIVITT